MIKEMARLHGLSVSEVREQIQGKIIDAVSYTHLLGGAYRKRELWCV